MPLNPSSQMIGFAKHHDPKEAQKFLDEFQLAVARAVVALGNQGCDPAIMADMLMHAGKAVGFDGYKEVAEVCKDLDPSILASVDPEMGKLGGNPLGMIALLAEHRAARKNVTSGAGIGFTANILGHDGPKKPTDIN